MVAITNKHLWKRLVLKNVISRTKETVREYNSIYKTKYKTESFRSIHISITDLAFVRKWKKINGCRKPYISTGCSLNASDTAGFCQKRINLTEFDNGNQRIGNFGRPQQLRQLMNNS